MRTHSETNANDAISIPAGLTEISTNVANNLVKIIRNEQDLWWFVVEQFNRLHSFKNGAEKILKFFPLKLHEVEYNWGKSEPFLVKVSNPGISYIQDRVMPVLLGRFGNTLAELAVAHAFSQYCLAYLIVIQRVRLDFAVHFRDNCKSSGHLSLSNLWDEVVHSLGGN